MKCYSTRPIDGGWRATDLVLELLHSVEHFFRRDVASQFAELRIVRSYLNVSKDCASEVQQAGVSIQENLID